MTLEEDPFDAPVAFEILMDLEEKRCTWIKLNEAQLLSYLSIIYNLQLVYEIHFILYPYNNTVRTMIHMNVPH